MLVLLNVDSLMRAYPAKLFIGDRQDDMTEDDATKGQRLSTLAAAGLALTIGDLQSAAPPNCFATKGERNGCQEQAHNRARRGPKQLYDFEPMHPAAANVELTGTPRVMQQIRLSVGFGVLGELTFIRDVIQYPVRIVQASQLPPGCSCTFSLVLE